MILAAAAVALAVLSAVNGIVLAAWAGVVGTLAAMVELVLRRTEREDPTIKEPAEARRLIDEAAFAIAVSESGYYPDALAESRPFLEAPVLIDKKKSRKAWKEATRRLEEIEQMSPVERPPYGLALEPILEVLPDADAYVSRIKHIPPEMLVLALESGYHTAYTEVGDLRAVPYLILMRKLGERKALLNIVKERLAAMREKGVFRYSEAYEQSREIARSILGPEFETWFRREVGPIYQVVDAKTGFPFANFLDREEADKELKRLSNEKVPDWVSDGPRRTLKIIERDGDE
jgi:hypothetical protein